MRSWRFTVSQRISLKAIRALLAILVLAGLTSQVTAQGSSSTRLVERVQPAAGRMVIPYSKYVLPNGLTVVVHEDHSDPVVHVDVTYHVGSAREEIGKSGFAHFFEHMMFQGSDNVADDQHFKILSESGGTLNGTTNRDRTNYFETVPNNQLEKALWLEADRMGFLLDAVTQKKFEIQRETVKNERGQNYDNVPYGLAGEMIAKALYPYGHPYSWLTIGYIEDLNRVGVDDLKNFFLRWYGPNNATLTVGGDVDTAKVVALTEKYFGPIPRGAAVTGTKLPPPTLAADRYTTLVDNYARQPQLRIVFPAVPLMHPDEAALDCLAEILGAGKNSIFYQELVKTQKALAASASNPTAELAGQFTLSLTPGPGVSLAQMKTLVDDAMKTFEARGVTDQDVARFNGATEAGLINALQSVSGKVSQLATFQTFTGSPNQIGRELQRYTTVTKADVLRVYNQYIKGKPAVILSIATKAQPDNVAGPANVSVTSAGYRAPDYGYAGLKYTKPKDAFDRSKLPGSGPNPVVKVPPFWRETLDGGISAIGVQSREVPTVALTLAIPGGHLLQAENPSKVGLARLFALMMNEDTETRTAEQIQDELQKLGSSVSVGSGLDEITINVQTLVKNLDKTLAIMEERLVRPKFTQTAFDRIKKQTLESFKVRNSQPANVATEVFAEINQGSTSILGISPFGTEQTVTNITLADVEDYYRRFITSRGSRLVVVGDVAQKDVVGRLGFLARLPVRDIKLPAVPAAPAVEKTRIYIVDFPKAAQTEFRVGYATGLKYDATGEYYRASLMNFPLGGDFNSRLNLNLREDKGWTYGARAGFSGNKYTGGFAFSSGIRADATADALAEVIRELDRYAASGVTAEELAFLKSAVGLRDARLYETPAQKAGFIQRILDYGLPADYVEIQNRILAGITKPELDRLSANWLKTGKMNILLVGDKASILPGVQKLGYEIVELDVNGDRVLAGSVK
jgi:zinc protease